MTTRTQSTPGPWKVGEVSVGATIDIPILADDEGECLIATVCHENTTREVAWADAALIAAAPDLLAALEAMIEVLRTGNRISDLAVQVYGAKAALAKADA